MVANDVARWISLIHRAAYLRCIISLLWRYAPYTFRNRLDLLSILFFFVGFLRRRRKFQLYLAVKCGKFGLQLFKFILLLPHFARYLLQLRYPLLQYLVHLFVTH